MIVTQEDREAARIRGWIIVGQGANHSYARPGAHVFPMNRDQVAAQSFDPARGGYHGPIRIYAGAGMLERALEAESSPREALDTDDHGWLVPPSPTNFPAAEERWGLRPFLRADIRLYNFARALGWRMMEADSGGHGRFVTNRKIAWESGSGWHASERSGPRPGSPMRLYGEGYAALRELLIVERPAPHLPLAAEPQTFTNEQARILKSHGWQVTRDLDYAEHAFDPRELILIATRDKPGSWTMASRRNGLEYSVGSDPLDLACVTRSPVPCFRDSPIVADPLPMV